MKKLRVEKSLKAKQKYNSMYNVETLKEQVSKLYIGNRKLNVCFRSKIISCKCKTSQNHRKVICNKGRESKNIIQWK